MGQESGAGLRARWPVVTSEPARVLGKPGHAAGQRLASWWKAAWPTCACSTRRPPGPCSRHPAQPGQAHAVLGLRAAGPGALHHGGRAASPSKAGVNEIAARRLARCARVACAAGWPHRAGVSAPVARRSATCACRPGRGRCCGWASTCSCAARRRWRARCCWWPTIFPGSTSWCCMRRTIAALSPRPTSKHWPLIGTLATGAGTLYIERESRRDAMRVVHHMAEALQAGDILAVFPEGTTSDGISLLPFHANLIQAAISAGARCSRWRCASWTRAPARPAWPCRATSATTRWWLDLAHAVHTGVWPTWCARRAADRRAVTGGPGRFTKILHGSRQNRC
jgi:hypothetical protein